MTPIRSFLTLSCLLSLTAVAGAQGITDLMRIGPRSAPVTYSAPASAPTAAPARHAAEYIVAMVNSEPITSTEVRSRVQQVLRENPNAAQMPHDQLVRIVLERLINDRAQIQAGKEYGIKVDDLAVDQAEQSVARSNQISVDELRQRVVAEGLSKEQFRSDLRDQLILTRLREREIESKVKISDADVDLFMKELRDGGNAAFPPNINIAQLVVLVPENASEADVAKLQQRAQTLAQRARAGEDFAKLVQQHSDAPNRASGGAMGLRSADRYPEPFVEATQSLPVGGVVGPIRSSVGFHVLKLLSKSQPGASDAVVTQTQVRHILLRNDPKLSTAEAVAQLGEFKRRIQAGRADFASLARDNSQDGSAQQGGELGWARPGMFVPEFEDAMERLAPGQISDPVVSRFGVHLIQVQDRREAPLSEAEQREAVRSLLREKKIEQATEAWAQEVRARAYVEYRDAPQR